MKRLLLVLTCAIALSLAAPCVTFAGQKPQGFGSADHKHHWFSFHWHHRDKQHRDKHDPLQKSPKSVGWWHHGPGPAGAGAK